MTTDLQRAPTGMEIQQREPSVLQLIQDAVHKGLDPAVLKELVALQQSTIRFQWEAEERQAKIDFDAALNSCQKQIGRIAPNKLRADTHSDWASYSQLDRTIRPIYTEAGFSLAFSEVAPIVPGKVRIQAILSRGGVSRDFFTEITPSTTGPKGNAMATATDADAIAASRAQRYLLLKIFNIAIGIDAEEKKGIPGESMPENALIDYIDSMKAEWDIDRLKEIFKECYTKAKTLQDGTAKDAFTKTYEAQKRAIAERQAAR